MKTTSEEFDALCIAIECGLIPRIKDDEFDVTKFNEFWHRYSESREKIRRREVNQMIAHEKERYTTTLIVLGSAFLGLLLWVLWYIAP